VNNVLCASSRLGWTETDPSSIQILDGFIQLGWKDSIYISFLKDLLVQSMGRKTCGLVPAQNEEVANEICGLNGGARLLRFNCASGERRLRPSGLECD
jgi:hypothetical protein